MAICSGPVEIFAELKCAFSQDNLTSRCAFPPLNMSFSICLIMAIWVKNHSGAFARWIDSRLNSKRCGRYK